jgi:hypothetical protein
MCILNFRVITSDLSGFKIYFKEIERHTKLEHNWKEELLAVFKQQEEK